MSWSGKRRRCQGGLEIGLFSPGDWQCVKCANINWARRFRCNICGEAKYPKVEARTGTGGGYDDREEVEYVQREDSDEEYDHFGRKKKRLEKLGMGDERDVDKSKNENDQFKKIMIVEEPQDGDEKKEDQELFKHKLPVEELQLREEKDEEDDEEENDEDLSKYDLFAVDEMDEEIDQIKSQCITLEDNAEGGKKQEGAKNLSKYDLCDMQETR